MALELNGSNQYLTASSGLGIVNVPISISCLVYLDQMPFAAGDEMAVVHLNKENDSLDWLTLRADDTNGDQDVQANLKGNGTVQIAESDVEVTASTWQHYGASYTLASRYAYLNGIPGPESTPSPGAMTNWVNFYIGAANVSGLADYVDGAIAEVGIWNAILTSAEMLTLSKGYSPLFVRPQNLVHYFPLVRSNIDVVGGLALTPINSPTVRAHPRVIYPSKIWTPSGEVGAPPPAGGQFIMINMSKLIIPVIYLKQGKTKRRDFMKNTFLASLGIK